MADLWGKGPCGKEAYLLTAVTHVLFVFIGVRYLAMLGLVTFVATKVTALPRQLSGQMPLITTKVYQCHFTFTVTRDCKTRNNVVEK